MNHIESSPSINLFSIEGLETSQHQQLIICSDIVLHAGALATQLQESSSVTHIESAHSVVSSADTEVEQFLIQELRQRMPKYDILSEESYKGGEKPKSDSFIVLDPIDGTNASDRKRPGWCTSLAVVEKGIPVMGIIYDPHERRLFWTIRGKGAYEVTEKGVQKLAVSSTPSLDAAAVWVDQRVVRTHGKGEKDRGVSDSGTHGFDIDRLLNNVRILDVNPSPSLALAEVASGKIDCFVQMQKPSWDFLAGQLLVEEAGGQVSTWRGNREFDLSGNDNNYVLASNGSLHKELKGYVKFPPTPEQEVHANYHVLVVGTGAVFEEKVQKALDYLGPSSSRILIDNDFSRIQEATGKGAFKIQADGLEPPLRLNSEQTNEWIAFIATPEHLRTIESLVKAGFRNFVVEKPLVNNKTEIKKLYALLKKYPDLKVYPMDFYVQKLAMLQLLTGKISPDDPRWSWIETEDGEPVSPDLCNALPTLIGDIEGIDVTILEGGNFGLPDLDKRPWLEQDKKRGGMLLDLGTHALAPLVAAGLITTERTDVVYANRYALGKNRHSYVPAKPRQPEMYAEALLSIHTNTSEIPLKLTVGKTFQQGGVWKMFIRGTTGNITIGLRTGDHLTIQPKGGSDLQLRLKQGSDPYKLAFQEARRYFRGEGSFDGNLFPMLGSLDIISRIKKASNQKK